MRVLPALFYSSILKFLYSEMDIQALSVMLISYLSLHKKKYIYIKYRGKSLIFQMRGQFELQV